MMPSYLMVANCYSCVTDVLLFIGQNSCLNFELI